MIGTKLSDNPAAVTPMAEPEVHATYLCRKGPASHNTVLAIIDHPWSALTCKAVRIVVAQEYGNFGNPMIALSLEDWWKMHHDEPAWRPLKMCQFCGFSRDNPCLTRQVCPNLSAR